MNRWCSSLQCIVDCSVTITNCTFVDNVATDYGGAVALDKFLSFSVRNSTFTRNRAAAGGALSLTQDAARSARHSKLFVQSSQFASNVANGALDGVGGAVRLENVRYVNDTNRARFENCSFVDNRALLGGGLFLSASSAIVNGVVSAFERNNATEGGALRLTGGSTADVSDTLFRSNRAVIGAVGIVAASPNQSLQGVLRLSRSSLRNNACNGLGVEQYGIVYVSGNATLDLINTTLVDNRCQGIIIASDRAATAALRDSVIANSSAPDDLLVADLWLVNGTGLVRTNSLVEYVVVDGGVLQFDAALRAPLKSLLVFGGKLLGDGEIQTSMCLCVCVCVCFMCIFRISRQN